ncbi:MAG: hypothetical protein KF753_18635 [Caldilineaceae bacterium]|nr:hypothetical protein [Caldilineaceae bacterium]
MTIPKRLSIKFHAEAAPGFDITQVVPVFHRWIRERAIENELIIDVADYKHVVDGPGILLVGHEADYGLDVVDGRLGLLYTRKREVGESLTVAFQTLFAQSTAAARRLEAEPELVGLRIHTDAGDVAILDRLHFENSDEGVNAIGPALEEVLAGVYSGGATARRVDNDPRQPLTVRVAAA